MALMRDGPPPACVDLVDCVLMMDRHHKPCGKGVRWAAMVRPATPAGTPAVVQEGDVATAHCAARPTAQFKAKVDTPPVAVIGGIIIDSARQYGTGKSGVSR